jgi:amino acid adenylation domain-containing protein
MPATQGQVRFWSLDQLNPGNPALNMPLMWQCTGPLRVEVMQQAFTECIRRHEALRTTFALVAGKVSQIVNAPYPAALPLVDLSALPEPERRAEGERVTREHAAFRFNLATGPLLQLKLIRFDATHHLLLVTMHHIICDGISLGILLRDMALSYEAIATRTEAALPELPIQFADFAVWQEDWLESGEGEKSLEFWRQSLGKDFERVNLARDPDAVDSLDAHREEWTGDIETLLIPKPLQERAHEFCRRENVTLNILLFSIFATLLQRLTGQLDLVIGSPCANRTEDTEELIGLFMNIQVMRLRLSEGEVFRSLLGKVQDWTLGAYEHQLLPFEHVVHDSFYGEGTQTFELPIFFLYQKSFMVTHRVAGVEIVPLRSESPGAVFEIFFAIVDRAEEGPRLQLEYNPRYFKRSTMQRYLHTFVNLLDSALNEPDKAIEELPLLGSEGLAQLAAWNRTEIDFGAYEPACNTFLRRAAQEPDTIAVECAGVRWTNRELASRAQHLAQRLLDAGLQPEDRVGIALDRSPHLVEALLAVMLAGGAYVPLDTRHPRARLEAVLKDSGAAWLIADQDPGLATGARLIAIGENGQPQNQSTDWPLTPAANSLAYVIYTSGSTGTPKGVSIEHGALTNLLRSMAREPGLAPHDVLVAITTLAFDIAALELLLPLVTGARLVIATEGEVRDGRQLLALLERSHATVLQATPGVWRLLLDAGWSEPNPGERGLKALCGGEALPRELAERILDRTPDLWNVYGPTETTIWSSATRVKRGKGSPRIGPPIANTQFYVLNRRMQPTLPGVTGELYIGGAGLARGYWKRPELTAAAFLPNPFGSGRLYKTGDLARWHDDGSIELLGRADFQVKVHGYRIELAEIEGTLMEHPAVREAVVTQQKSGAARLVAYVSASSTVLSGGSTIARLQESLPAELRTALAAKLPEYMVPDVYCVLADLPRNTNGKIDRKALPEVGEGAPLAYANSAREAYFPPMDVIERQLQDIWQTTLGIPRISVRASFFSLGVGSLAALRLITKMNRIFAMDLGLASLISASTIESIAELIRTRFAPNRDSSLVPLQSNGDRTPLFIVHGVGGNVVNFYGLAMRVGKDQPVYGIQSQALVANQPALLHLKDMARHYIADVRKVQPHGPYYLLGYSFGGTVVLEMAHQLRAAGEEVALVGMIDSKSRDFEETLAGMKSVQDKVNHRLNRFSGNIGSLSWKSRTKYIWDKMTTRAIRYACFLAAELSFTRVPAFMRSAWDINVVAVKNYKLRPYDGKLVLFRASEQDFPSGALDLGWGSIFTQGVEIHELPGDHERIFLEPNIERLAASLRESLARTAA